MRPCICIRGCVPPSVGPSVTSFLSSVNFTKNQGITHPQASWDRSSRHHTTLPPTHHHHYCHHYPSFAITKEASLFLLERVSAQSVPLHSGAQSVPLTVISVMSQTDTNARSVSLEIESGAQCHVCSSRAIPSVNLGKYFSRLRLFHFAALLRSSACLIQRESGAYC